MQGRVFSGVGFAHGQSFARAPFRTMPTSPYPGPGLFAGFLGPLGETASTVQPGSFRVVGRDSLFCSFSLSLFKIQVS